MSMIAGGDESARNAFRAILRDEPSRPNLTQELDASDILEVRDLARAIERAEQMLTPLPVAPVSSRPEDAPAGRTRDIFDMLATDDAAGPAAFAPARPTPVPPAPPTVRSPVPASTLAPARAPSGPASAPILDMALEEDAYFQPGGRIRSLADESLQIHRPQPTLLLRIQTRRRTATWVAAGVIGFLGIVIGTALIVQATGPEAEVAPASTTTLTTALAPTAATAVTAATPVTAAAEPATTATATTPAATPAIPVFDVNSLPAASK